LQPAGNFAVTVVGPEFTAQLFPQIGAAGEAVRTMIGWGFWNEISQAISFTLHLNTATVGQQALAFTGYQVHPPPGAGPGQDLVWTLVGEFRHAFGGPMISLADESARRFVFGWYAQITQIL